MAVMEDPVESNAGIPEDLAYDPRHGEVPGAIPDPDREGLSQGIFPAEKDLGGSGCKQDLMGFREQPRQIICSQVKREHVEKAGFCKCEILDDELVSTPDDLAVHSVADRGSGLDFGGFSFKHLGDEMVGGSKKTVSELACQDVGPVCLFMEAVEGQVIADIGNEEDKKTQADAKPDDVYSRSQPLLPEDPKCRLEVAPYHVFAPNVSKISILVTVAH